MKQSVFAGAFAALAGFGLSPASAAVVNWAATLEQAQEFPSPVAVAGAAGSATGTIDTISNQLTWTISFAGLSGPLTGLHFHAPAAPGVNAPVVVNVGSMGGLTSPSSGFTELSPFGTSAFLDGFYYINAHTILNPAGEIRGQVIPAPIPLPAALPLAGTALFLLALIGRRRRPAT